MFARRVVAVVFAVGALVLVLFSAGQAVIPQKMNYQVMLTDDSDQPLADRSVQLVFRVYDQSAGGGQLWTEAHNATTNSIGVVSVILGETNPLAISFDGPLWLQVEVDGEVLSPRRELTSAPYALGSPGGASDGHSLDADDGDPVDVVYVNAAGEVIVNAEDVYGNNSVRLPEGCISAGEIMDEPGVASDISLGCTVSSSVTSAASRTIVAPSNGYILAIGTLQFNLAHEGSLNTSVTVGLTDAFPNHASSQNSTVTVDAEQPAGIYTHIVTVQGIFSASPSQAKTIDVFVQKVQGAWDSDCFRVHLSLLFVPTLRGTVETIDAPTALGETDNDDAPDSEKVLVPRSVLDELMSRVERLEEQTGDHDASR